MGARTLIGGQRGVVRPLHRVGLLLPKRDMILAIKILQTKKNRFQRRIRRGPDRRSPAMRNLQIRNILKRRRNANERYQPRRAVAKLRRRRAKMTVRQSKRRRKRPKKIKKQRKPRNLKKLKKKKKKKK